MPSSIEKFIVGSSLIGALSAGVSVEAEAQVAGEEGCVMDERDWRYIVATFNSIQERINEILAIPDPRVIETELGTTLQFNDNQDIIEVTCVRNSDDPDSFTSVCAVAEEGLSYAILAEISDGVEEINMAYSLSDGIATLFSTPSDGCGILFRDSSDGVASDVCRYSGSSCRTDARDLISGLNSSIERAAVLSSY